MAITDNRIKGGSSQKLIYLQGDTERIVVNASGVSELASTGTAATATLAATSTVVAETTDTSCSVAIVTAASGSLPIKTNTGLTFNAATGMLTATGVTAPVTGNASTATTAAVATAITLENEATDTSCFPLFGTAATGNLGAKTNAGLAFNSATGMLTATGVTAPLTGNASTASTAAVATAITLADEATDTSCFPLFGTAATGNLGAKTNTGLTFNSATGMLTATGVTAPLTGTASIATAITLADEATDTSCFPLFGTAATGNLGAKTNAGLTFNSATAALGATSFVGPLTGAVTGDVTGNVSGYALKSQARTATNDGTGDGTIAAGVTHVVVTSDHADKIIILPAPVVGLKITLLNGGTGYELRSSDPATIAINGGTEAAGESAIGANLAVKMECVSATAWLGATVSAAGVVGVVQVAAAA